MDGNMNVDNGEIFSVNAKTKTTKIFKVQPR